MKLYTLFMVISWSFPRLFGCCVGIQYNMVLITPKKWVFNGSSILGLSFHPIIITDAFSFEMTKKHFPCQVSQQVIKQFSKEHKVEFQFNERLLGNRREEAKFNAQKDFIHLTIAKEEMLQEVMIFINRNCDTQIAMPMCNCHMPKRNKTRIKKRWNDKRNKTEQER